MKVSDYVYRRLLTVFKVIGLGSVSSVASRIRRGFEGILGIRSWFVFVNSIGEFCVSLGKSSF